VACKVISSKRTMKIKSWGWVGIYLLPPIMTLGLFLGALFAFVFLCCLPERWGDIQAERPTHAVPSGTKQQRRQEVLKIRKSAKKWNKALKRWRQQPRISALTQALLATAQSFPRVSTSAPPQLAVPCLLCLTLPRIVLQPLFRTVHVWTTPRFRYLRPATRISDGIGALQDLACIRS
jgi:hypothetical protein